MTEILQGLVERFGSTVMGEYLLTFFVSMMPIVELRLGLPLAVGMGMNPWVALFVCLLGNILPVPFIVIFIRRIFKWLRKKSAWLENLVSRMEKKAEKNYSMIQKYELLGLYILVAIPLPGTGAWTGALVAALLEMRLKHCFLAIALGVLTAGIIMLIITYGVTALF